MHLMLMMAATDETGPNIIRVKSIIINLTLPEPTKPNIYILYKVRFISAISNSKCHRFQNSGTLVVSDPCFAFLVL